MIDAEQTCKTYRKLAFLTTCQTHANDVFGIALNIHDIEAMVDSHPYLTEEWNKYYYDQEEQTKGYMDTCVREAFHDAFAWFFLGKHIDWPLNMDSDEYKKGFISNLFEAMKEKGYSVN